MRLRLCAVLALMTFGLTAAGETPCSNARETVPPADWPAGLELPEVLLDGSEHGTRLFPGFGDFDSDGTIDLLVGVGDRLLVYRNRGTDARPVYADSTWFDETEPSARIPAG